MMSTKANKELVHQIIKERDEFAADVVKLRSWCEKYCAPGIIHHLVPPRDLNWEQNAQYFASLASIFPDFIKTVNDMVAEGDKVVVRYTVQATHKGTFAGIPATGKRVTLKGSDIFKIEGRKIVEWWEYPDILGALLQVVTILSPPPKT